MADRRVWVGLLLAALLLLVGVRLALPWALRNVAVHQLEQALDAHVEIDTLELSLWAASLGVAGLRVSPSESPEEPQLRAGRADLRLGRRALLAGRLEVAVLALEDAEIVLERDADGALSFGIEGFSEEAAEEAAAEAAEGAPEAWALRLVRVGLADVRLRVREPEGGETRLDVAQARVRDLVLGGELGWQLEHAELDGMRLVLPLEPEGFELRGSLRSEAIDAGLARPTPIELALRHGDGRLDARGNVAPAEGRGSFALSWKELELPRLLTALAPEAAEQVALRQALSSGEAEAELTPASDEAPARLTLRGTTSVDKADFTLPGSRIDAAWKRLEAQVAEARIPLDGSPALLRLDRLRLDAPVLRWTLPPEQAAASAAGPAPRVAIAALEVDDGLLRVIDPQAPEGELALSGARLRASNLRSPGGLVEKLVLAAAGPGGGPLRVEGRLGAKNGRFSLSGEKLSLEPLAPLLSARSNYRVTRGAASFAAAVELEGDAYRAPTKLTLHDFGLETDDEGKSFVRQFGMPPELALALLRDAKREIALELPLAGSRKGARVALLPVLGRALRDALLNALQKPLALLGSVVIRDDRLASFDLAAVVFAPGSAELSGASGEHIARTAEVLAAHPQLRIELVPLLVPEDSRTASTPDELRALSARRAVAVRDALGDAGISVDRVTVREGPPALAAGEARVGFVLDAAPADAS